MAKKLAAAAGGSPRKPGRGRWIRKYQVWNVKAKRYIRRKDGKPFVFWVP